ncbi:MAG: ATP-binding cassette domain-containing protein [Acidimicrobiia bacterium]
MSFRMRLGEIYGVIGANGSGKSTMIRILSTLLLPDDGDVRVFGRDAIRDPLPVRPPNVFPNDRDADPDRRLRLTVRASAGSEQMNAVEI